MPFPQWLAQVNRRFTNPMLLRLVKRPPFAALTHTGRVSGASYRIPINAFPAGGGFVVACTYGRDADWVRNVCAAGEATLEYGGESIDVWQPRLVGADEGRAHIPSLLAFFLALVRVHDYLLFERRNPQAA